MARKIKTWTRAETRPSLMDPSWTDGDLWTATRDEDFPEVKVETFRTYLYRYAKSMGMDLKTEIVSENVIEFQFLPLQERSARSER